MEHRQRTGTREQYPRNQRLTALAIATAALLNTSMTVGRSQSTPERQVRSVTEQYMPRSSEGEPVAIGPEYTIIIPSEGNNGRIDWSANTADEAALRQNGEWCNTPNVPLYQRATREQISAAAQEEMGLSAKEYTTVEVAMAHADTREEAQEVVRATFAGLGIEATFNGHKTDLITDTKKYDDMKSESAFGTYKKKLEKNLRFLTILPKEMASIPKSVDIIETDRMGLKDKDGNLEKYVGGYITDDGEGVVVPLGASDWVSVHEWAHVMHRKACNGPNGTQFYDGEFREAYEKAIKVVNSSKGVKRLEQKWPKDHIGSEEWSSEEFAAVTGFPSKYSKSDYAELMADLTTYLLMKGDMSDINGLETVQAHELKQLTVERMQAAAPNTDVASLVAARSVYPMGSRYILPVQLLLESRVSPIDKTFQSNYQYLAENNAVLRPAIHIQSADKQRDEYIYAHEQDILKKPEGQYGGSYSLYFNKSGDEKLDDTIVVMALEYLQERAVLKDITLEYEIREFDDIYFVQGAYLTDGVSEQPAKIIRTDYTEEGRAKSQSDDK